MGGRSAAKPPPWAPQPRPPWAGEAQRSPQGPEPKSKFLAAQGLAAELSGIDPKTDWGAFLASYHPGSEQGQYLLQAIIPYALIGAGAVGSYRH
ncbi:MAG: hypothetical protein O3A87_11940, partial [Verrucomicrobia bacterium]|nr:hypothetical protein [Verrucomicrobiota bacterium]